jgi:hypothetical protein
MHICIPSLHKRGSEVLPCFSWLRHCMTAGRVSTRVSGSEHTFCLPKVLYDNNLDFLQAHAGLHMLSLDIDESRRMGRDFQVAALIALKCCRDACRCYRVHFPPNA